MAPLDQLRTAENPCVGPDLLAGTCKSIRQCPAILNQFVARQNDQEYIQFVKNSNAICEYVQPNVSNQSMIVLF